MAKSKRLEAVRNLADDLKSLVTEEPAKTIDTPIVEKREKKPTNMPWYPPSQVIRKELKQLALDEDKTIQALFTEAIQDLFEKRGKRFEDFI